MSQDIEETPVTVVDERFWLEWAVKVVDTTPSRLDEGASRIATAMGWFWGAYTAVILAGSLIRVWSLDPGLRLLVAAPSILLFVAYALASWAAMPTRVEFDPREPWAVKSAYDQTAARKWARVTTGLAFGIAAAIAVAVAIVLVLAGGASPESRVSVGLDSQRHRVLVFGVVPAGVLVTARVTSDNGSDVQQMLTADPDGHIDMAIPTSGSSVYTVVVRWESRNQETSIRRELRA